MSPLTSTNPAGRLSRVRSLITWISEPSGHGKRIVAEHPGDSMGCDVPSKAGCLQFSCIGDFVLEAERRAQATEERSEEPTSYRIALGREVIHLGIVEFRILLLLAGRPYLPFSRRRIADAVGTEDDPVTEETVDQHIASLRDQLGFFHDYVQSVPYIGYRFKA